MTEKTIGVFLFWSGILATVIGLIAQDVGAAFCGGYCTCFGTQMYFEEDDEK